MIDGTAGTGRNDEWREEAEDRLIPHLRGGHAASDSGRNAAAGAGGATLQDHTAHGRGAALAGLPVSAEHRRRLPCLEGGRPLWYGRCHFFGGIKNEEHMT